jgi:SAM-dependent methyltransferase
LAPDGVSVPEGPAYVATMNPEHLDLLASDDWRDVLRDFIVPWALGSTELGDDVLEVGPGPGLTTDLLLPDVARLTAIELDAGLAAGLAERLHGTGATVVHGSAADMPFEDDRFTGAVSFTMLHHVPTVELQDRVFAEAARVLRPGGVLVLSDSIASDDLAALHHDDVYNPVDPATVEPRLATAGFSSIEVRVNDFGWTARAHAA